MAGEHEDEEDERWGKSGEGQDGAGGENKRIKWL